MAEEAEVETETATVAGSGGGFTCAKLTRACVTRTVNGTGQLDLGAGGNRRLKCYNESMMNAMCEVVGVLQLEDERWH